MVSQVEKFVSGKGVFGNVWVVEETPHGPLSVIPQKLHRQHGKVYAAGNNVTIQVLEKAAMSKHVRVSGRTIRLNASLAIKECKKMMSLVDEAVKEKILVKCGSEYEYHSGKNEEDMINFVLYRMFNWKEFNGPSGATVSTGEDSPAEDISVADPPAEEAAQESVDEDTSDSAEEPALE